MTAREGHTPGGVDFIIRDYPRLSDSLDLAREEITALQTLVSDMVAATVPNLGAMSSDLWDDGAWQIRARQVICGVPLVRCEVAG